MNFFITQLGIAQPRHRIIFIQALLRLRSGFDMPLNQRQIQRLRYFFSQHGFTCAGFAFNQQWFLQLDSGIYCHLQFVGCNVFFRSGKVHSYDSKF